ncbi:hypothetical protein GQ457_04G020130 [Hibiscus cannabinus]
MVYTINHRHTNLVKSFSYATVLSHIFLKEHIDCSVDLALPLTDPIDVKSLRKSKFHLVNNEWIQDPNLPDVEGDDDMGKLMKRASFDRWGSRIGERAYISPRSVTYEEGSFRQAISYHMVSELRKPAPQAPLQVRERAESSKPKPPVADVGCGKQLMHQERLRDILCFKCLGRGHIASQCPNRRTMLLLDSGEIESESEKDEPELPKETVQEEDDTLQSFETGDVLVIKRSLTTQPTQDNQQRENIFHTRCLVNNKVCVVIIDGGSCTNVASSIMVEKLGLKTTKHPNPYRLQWLNDGGEIKVTKQVLVPFTIGKYKDEVLCDVVAMGACHLLLGRPWQFDKGTLHDGVTNRYSFMHAGQKITLAPLTPSQVQEDQVRLRNNMEEAKEKKKIECEKEDSNAKVLSIPTSSSNFSNLQVSALFPKEVPKVASVGRLRTFMCLTEIQQPSLPRFDVPFSFTTDFSPLPVKSSSCKLDFVSSDVFLIDCRGHDCCLEFCIIVCRFDNVQRALSVYMLCIIRKGTRTKASLAPSDSEFLVEVVESSGWYWCQLRRKRKFPAKRKSKLFPFVVVVDLGTNRFQEGGMMKPAPQAPLQVRERAESSKPKPPVADVGCGKQLMHQERLRDILCFKCLGRGHIASQCPNRRTMLLLDSGEIESESEEDEPELPKETVQEEDDTLQSFEAGDVLVIKRSLTTQPTQDNQQRENIFHTRCLVNNKVCVVIIDGGSCTNVASSIMVEKLGLKTTKHPNPYRLKWLNDGGEIKVTKQVLVPFTIGKYKDEVLCDVVEMGACHLLLGRPWQFDKGTLHDGVTNRYSFMHAGQKITLAPLTPSQVQEDQVRLRNNMEEAKEKKKIEREKEDSNAKVLSIPTSSSNFSNLQVSALFPKEVPKVASVGRLRTFMCLTEIQQPSLPRFDVPFSFTTDFSPLPVKSSSCKLDFVSSDVFLIDCRGHDCCLEFCIIVCRFDNVRRALSVYMLCIIRKGTRTKASLAPSDSEFLVEVVESSGWYWCQLRRKRKFPAKRKSKLFPFVVVVDLGTNRFQEGGMM